MSRSHAPVGGRSWSRLRPGVVSVVFVESSPMSSSGTPMCRQERTPQSPRGEPVDLQETTPMIPGENYEVYLEITPLSIPGDNSVVPRRQLRRQVCKCKTLTLRVEVVSVVVVVVAVAVVRRGGVSVVLARR